MAIIKVKRTSQARPPKSGNDAIKDLLATFCYHYPQYTFEQALDLSIKTMKRLLKAAYREKAKEYFELAQIARISRSEKNAPYDQLVKRYEKEALDG